MTNLTRRDFMRSSIAVGAGLVMAAPHSRVRGANNDIRLAVGSRDLGQWVGSGVDPVQAAGTCKAEPVSLRLQDLPDAAIAAKIELFVQELQRQRVAPAMFGIERGNTADPMPGMRRIIDFFNQLSLKVAKRGTP